MAGTNYDLLLLDFGGVCLLNPVELHATIEAALGLEQGTFTWMGPVDPSTDDLWQELMAGDVLREREYWHRRAADVGVAAGRELSLEEYMGYLYSPPDDSLVRAACVDVVDRAQSAGYRVSILTNDLRAFHGPDWAKGIRLLSQVDHVVDCSDTGILKPDPRAFERAMAITGQVPERVLFVDDQPLSVAGARAVGMDAEWFDIAHPDESWARVADRLAL